MKENSRIRFNPVAKEIEVEGSESFVKTYFNKLFDIMSGSPGKTLGSEMKGAAKAVKEKLATDESEAASAKPKVVKRVSKAAPKGYTEKKLTNIETIVTLIQEHEDGITTAELKQKTGLAESQIWNIVNRATKEGRIRKISRGLYGPGEGENAPEIDGPVME